MTRSVRLQWLAWCGLSIVGCTKLQDPNQWFGDVDRGGEPSVAGAVSSSGAAGAEAGGNDSGAPSAGCDDRDGFNGLGCYRCSPTDLTTLENACTTATCVQFDDARRLTLLPKDGKLPALPSSAGAGGVAGTPGVGGAPGAVGGSPASAGTAGGSPASGGTAGQAQAGASAGVGGGLETGGGAGAAMGTGTACKELAKKGTVVYITGSSAAKPFLQQIAQQLAAQNIFIVYTATGSCVGVDAVVNGTPMTTGPTSVALSATYWDSSASTGATCDLPSEGVSADIGASDVFAQSCAGFELANLDALQVRDAHGPIQTMTFVVPANSAYSEISATAAYFAFGFGAKGGLRDPSGTVSIWNNEDYLFKRSPSSGTQAMLAAAIGVPASAWKGKPHKTSDDLAADLQAAGQKQDTANAALGILAADYIDTKNLRAQLRVLSFQDTAQHCAVYPDSSSNSHDKRNVRDGHYPVWGPLHLLLRIDAMGKPLNPASRQAVTDIVGYLAGTKALPNNVKLIDVYAQSGLVPECAMRVTRSKDGGNIFPYHPSSPCSCLFDAQVTGSTSCKSCTVQGDCDTGQTCSQGYCEQP